MKNIAPSPELIAACKKWLKWQRWRFWLSDEYKMIRLVSSLGEPYQFPLRGPVIFGVYTDPWGNQELTVCVVSTEESWYFTTYKGFIQAVKATIYRDVRP